MTDHQPYCQIIPDYLLRRLAERDEDLAPTLEAALREAREVRGRREMLGTRWEGGQPPTPPVPASEDDSRRAFLPPQLSQTLSARSTLVEGDPDTTAEDDEPVLDDELAATPQRLVHDAEHRSVLPGKLVRAEGDPDTGDVTVREAYDGLGHTFEMLAQHYGRDSLDDAGLSLIATVHYGRDYDNAFWDGRQMVFGDGDGIYFNRFTASLDVIAHELAHGLIQYTAGLTYVGQPGALNESVADVFGALVTQWAKKQDVHDADWLVGADLFTERVRGRALRSMAEPGTAYDDPVLGVDPQPGHMDDYVGLPHDADHDNGGVHINSGIPNRAFCLFATALGGYSWDRAGQVWYDTLTTRGLIPRDVDFAGFAAATLTAASTRYGDDSEVVVALGQAWAAVGVPIPDASEATEPDQPEPDQPESGVLA